MCDALQTIYGGEKNVERTKSESLRGKFDDMRMEEGENIAQYVARIKEVVSAIKGSTSSIDDDTMLSKVLRKFLAIYAIRVFAIQELRCIAGNNLTLEGLVGRLTDFELSNFDNYKPGAIESSFKDKLLLKDSEDPYKQKKRRKEKCVSSDSDTDEEDVDHLEAFLARRFHRGKGKFKGKLPIICFNCNEIGHVFSLGNLRGVTKMGGVN